MSLAVVVRKNNLYPLDAIPEKAILVTDAYSEELLALRQSIARREGFILVRDTSESIAKERFASTFKLQNIADCSLDLDGSWYLGRTHQFGASLRIIINVNDSFVDYPVRRCIHTQIFYSAKGVLEGYRGLNNFGSANFHGALRDFKWRCVMDQHHSFEKFYQIDAHRVPVQAPL